MWGFIDTVLISSTTANKHSILPVVLKSKTTGIKTSCFGCPIKWSGTTTLSLLKYKRRMSGLKTKELKQVWKHRLLWGQIEFKLVRIQTVRLTYWLCDLSLWSPWSWWKHTEDYIHWSNTVRPHRDEELCEWTVVNGWKLRTSKSNHLALGLQIVTIWILLNPTPSFQVWESPSLKWLKCQMPPGFVKTVTGAVQHEGKWKKFLLQLSFSVCLRVCSFCDVSGLWPAGWTHHPTKSAIFRTQCQIVEMWKVIICPF